MSSSWVQASLPAERVDSSSRHSSSLRVMKCPVPNPGSSPVAHTVAKCDGRIERVSVHSDVLTYVLDEKQQSGPVLGVPVERRASVQLACEFVVDAVGQLRHDAHCPVQMFWYERFGHERHRDENTVLVQGEPPVA